MQITLHWWAWPIVLMLFSFAVMARPREHGGYIDVDFTGMVVFFICAAASIGIVVGKFI
jgi:hypothetical protein